jgi:hypothetical protein
MIRTARKQLVTLRDGINLPNPIGRAITTERSKTVFSENGPGHVLSKLSRLLRQNIKSDFVPQFQVPFICRKQTFVA